MSIMRTLEQRMRPPRIGTIGLGIVVGTGTQQRPSEVDYFVVPPDGPIARVYGDKPKRLAVRFPWPEPTQVLHSIAYTLRAGRSVVRRCDGERSTEIQRGGDVVSKCERPAGPYAQCPAKCRATARLSVIVPKTPFGIWEIGLGGTQRIATVLGDLTFCRGTGPLTQFPFELERVEVQEQYYDAQGQVRSRKGYPMRVRSPFTLEEVVALQEARGLPIALPAAEEDVLDDEPEASATAPAIVASDRSATAAPSSEPMPPAADEATAAARHFDAAVPPKSATWDISMCQRAAARLGATDVDYRRYLLGVYGTDELTDAQILEQRDFLKDGYPAKGQAAVIREVIAKVAKKVDAVAVTPRQQSLA